MRVRGACAIAVLAALTGCGGHPPAAAAPPPPPTALRMCTMPALVAAGELHADRERSRLVVY
ncbi:MAG TPA: hypothetical protein VL172_00180 [Kofleriaceae bacterium]|nr:hypothetical protein [Kofleriaceae bacterium]